MKSKRSLYLSICVAICLAPVMSLAQLPLYYIIIKKGNCLIKRGSLQNQDKSFDNYLFEKDTVSLSATDAELYLVDHHQMLLVVNKPGTYHVADLHATFSYKPIGVTKKYFNLVTKDIFKPKHSWNISKREEVASSWGAGERGDNACDLEIAPALDQVIYADSITFTWNISGPGKSYDLVLYTEQGTVLLKKSTTDTSVAVDRRSIQPDEKGKRTLYYGVGVVGEQCPPYPKCHFFLLNKADAHAQISTIVQKILKTDNVLLYNLKVADELGKNGFADEAYFYYVKTMELLTQQQSSE